MLFLSSLSGLEFFQSFSFILQILLIFRQFGFKFSFYQRPQRPRWPPLSGPLFPRLAPRLPPRGLPRTGPPPSGKGFGDRLRAHAGAAVAGRRARAAAGRVGAAMTAAVPLPPPFFWQAQGLVRLTLVLISWQPVRLLMLSGLVRHRLFVRSNISHQLIMILHLRSSGAYVNFGGMGGGKEQSCIQHGIVTFKHTKFK